MRRLLMLATLVVALVLPASAFADAGATLTPATAFSTGNRQIDAGPSTSRTYTLTSTGTDPLTVQTVELTGADAAQFVRPGGTCVAGMVLAQTQTCTVQVAFAPTATGARTTTLQIVTNGPTLTSANITGTGRDLAVAGGPLDFSGRVGAGAGTGQTVTITNEDTADYALGAVTVSGGQANQFSKTADTCSSVTLAAGARLHDRGRVRADVAGREDVDAGDRGLRPGPGDAARRSAPARDCARPGHPPVR